MIDWLILVILIILPFLFAVYGSKNKTRSPRNKFRYYFKDIAFSLVFLFLIFVLNHEMYKTLNFEKIEKGFSLNKNSLSALYPIFFVTLVLSFTKWSNLYPKDINTKTELMGYPAIFLPDNMKEYLIFFIYILTGVVFEELICRQFMFYSFNQTLNLKGDVLVLASSIFFSIGHFYQGWKGMLAIFLLGLLIGKIFLVTESIFVVILLHLALNLTITVLAFRRIRDLKIKEA